MEAVPISQHDSPSVVLELIYRLKVKDVMTKNVISVPSSSSMREIQALMRDNTITGIPIVDNGLLSGIISMQDIIEALDSGKINQSAKECMTQGVIVLEDDMPLSFAINYLNKYKFGRFPVVDREQKVVGIITSSDIIRTLLVEINREVQRLEEQVRTHEKNPDSTERLEFSVVRFDFESAGRASTEIKKALKSRGIDSAIVRRTAIASYELEMNEVIHSIGGTLSCYVDADKIELIAKDSGPGIKNLNEAMNEGFSTANDWIRSLGFGAGMGLPNTKRVADEFDITSTEKGTCVKVIIYTKAKTTTIE